MSRPPTVMNVSKGRGGGRRGKGLTVGDGAAAAEDADGASLLVRVWEDGDEEGERGGDGLRGEDAAERAEDDQRDLRVDEAGPKGDDAQNCEPTHKRLFCMRCQHVV
jgi:hypothetical protein